MMKEKQDLDVLEKILFQLGCINVIHMLPYAIVCDVPVRVVHLPFKALDSIAPLNSHTYLRIIEL